MTKLYEKQMVNVVVGSKCDKCGEVSEYQALHFHIENRLGYESDYDGLQINFSLCDHCFLEIVIQNNINFESPYGNDFDTMEELKTELKRIINIRKNGIST